jgi:class I fructose-bisphosphate aldolase
VPAHPGAEGEGEAGGQGPDQLVGSYNGPSQDPQHHIGDGQEHEEYERLYLGVTIQADIIKQKQPECNGGYTALNFGKTHKKVYSELTTDHPIDWTRYQVANCYLGRAGLINSGGASGENDLAQAARTAVINKRAGGMGLISGRKAFQKPMKDGVELLNTIQDVYLSPQVTVA